MKIEQAPAAIPAALFLSAIWVGGSLVSAPVGSLVVGAALAAALRGRVGVRFCALFLGLLCTRLQPSTTLPGFETTRPAEAVGWVAGDWRDETLLDHLARVLAHDPVGTTFYEFLTRLHQDAYTGTVVLHFGQGKPMVAEIPGPTTQVRLK